MKPEELTTGQAVRINPTYTHLAHSGHEATVTHLHTNHDGKLNGIARIQITSADLPPGRDTWDIGTIALIPATQEGSPATC